MSAPPGRNNPLNPEKFFPITVNQPRYRRGPKRSRYWTPQVRPCAHTRDPKTLGEVLLRGIKESA